MLNKVDFYYFSPTGGTKKTGELLTGVLARVVNAIDLGSKEPFKQAEAEVAVIAVPVYGGRIPSIVIDRLKGLSGDGKKAVTLVVYGNRAYEDALLELNNNVTAAGFNITASGAFVTRNSLVPEVGAGRPDTADQQELQAFAAKIVDKLEKKAEDTIQVPGRYPYEAEFSMPVTPIVQSNCKLCGKCETICPTEAITIKKGEITTDVDKCILCLACVYHCASGARILPPPLQDNLNQMLGGLKEVRSENASFI